MASWSWTAGKPARLGLQNPSLDDCETRRIFSLTKSEMLKRNSNLISRDVHGEGQERQDKSVKVKKQMKCLQAALALAGEGGAQDPVRAVALCKSLWPQC